METTKHKVDQQKFEELIQKDKPTLADMIISLQHQLYTLKTTVYGTKCKSEKTPQELLEINGQMEFAFFTEEEKKATEEKLSQIEAEEAQHTTVVKEHLRKNRSCTNTDISDLPVETIILEPEGINDKNREDYTLIGTEITKTIAIQPRRVYIQEIVRNKYVLKSQLQYQGTDQPTFIIAPAPVSVIPKCMASVSILVDIIILKYLYHMPLHRIIRMYKELGLRISSSTVNDWFNEICDLARPLYNELRKKVLNNKYIHCDETFEKLYDQLKKKVCIGYLWALCEGIGGNTVFVYENGKKDEKAANSILGLYNGSLQTDCNAIYNKYDNNPHIITVGCWSHCRRYWIKALDDDWETASKAVAMINKLYSIEHDAIIGRMTSQQRYELRQKESLQVIQTFAEWLSQLNLSRYAEKSPTKKAINYTIAHFKKLTRYIDDGDYSIDNNKIESHIRPIKIGLNAYQYFHNDDAAYRSAMIYSLIATCDGNDVNPREWLEDVLPRLRKIDYDTDEGKAQVAVLLPDEWKKSHPDSHSPIEHMTEEEHIQQLLCSRNKRSKSVVS